MAKALNDTLLLRATFVFLSCVTTAGFAQSPSVKYPGKTVRMLVGSDPGSGVDVTARLVALKLSERLGQSFTVDNRSGAAGAIAQSTAALAAPDGYTLVIGSLQSLIAMLQGTIATDIPKKLSPVIQLTSQPFLLTISVSLPANSVRDLIALAKSRRLLYASPALGGTSHVGMELFKYMAGVDMTHVPYKGIAGSITDMIAGRVDASIVNSLTAVPLVRGGKLKALAVTSAQRSKFMPDLPAIAETIAGYELVSWYGLYAPLGTPSNIILTVNRETNQILRLPEVIEKLAAAVYSR